MSDTLLEVKNLKAYYATSSAPVRAVEDVSIDLSKNEILGIAGESGCGKSTLANAILRLLKPPGQIMGGEVLFDGVNLLNLDMKNFRKIRWKHLSVIPQGSMNSLNPIMKIVEQIADAITTHEGKIPKREQKKRIDELLTSVGLSSEVMRMHPHELSGGMRQRVMIAMAIALGPKLVVADEPTTALDVVVQRGILELLLNIKKKMGSSILLITHDMAAQAEVSDRVAVMYAGKIAEIADTETIFEYPQHPYTQALIGAVPSIEAKRKLFGLVGLPPDLRSPPPGCRFHPRCPIAVLGKCDISEPLLHEYKGRQVACHLRGD